MEMEEVSGLKVGPMTVQNGRKLVRLIKIDLDLLKMMMETFSCLMKTFCIIMMEFKYVISMMIMFKIAFNFLPNLSKKTPSKLKLLSKDYISFPFIA